MNEKDLSSLSYKELQSLAVKYRVPGNIKKHLLIGVLQAVKSGNEIEVDRILRELHQARKKKRLKKLKRDNLDVSTSSPMHSPRYAMSEADCYYPDYPQQQPPYNWVGAEEEVVNRNEDPLRVPGYNEFERFLLRKLQRDYQSLALNENGQVSSIVDLRMAGAGSSTVEPIIPGAINQKSNITIETDGHARPLAINAQTAADTNGNNEEMPALLKKMLEAPAGANLGAIASPQKRASYGMWASENYPSCNNTQDGSDTLTADSDLDNENNENNWELKNNNNNGGGYYCFMNNNNNNKSTSRGNPSEEKTFETTENFLAVTASRYELAYPISDIQANCQKWISTNSFVNRDANNVEQFTENSRGFHPIYYDETSENSPLMRPINLERKNPYNAPHNQNNVIYDANQAILQEQMSHHAHKYYQNHVTTAPVNPTDVYYSQQIGKGIDETTQPFFSHGSYANANTIHNVYQNPIVEPELHHPPLNTFNKEAVGSCVQNFENNALKYNTGYYQQYNHQNNQPISNFHYETNPYEQEVNQQTHNHHHRYHHEHQIPTPEIGCRKNNPAQTLQPISNGALDPFWPRWPVNGISTSGMQLETILNLRHCIDVDKRKIEETSCVYCYSTPVVTQRIDVSSCSMVTGEKRLVAECRKHLFSPNRLVYNDASTGMRMSIISEISNSAEISVPEESSPSTDADCVTGVQSTESSDDSINDVWIHDYSRYPVSSDNGPHSVDLIIDENEDDIFGL